MATSVFDQALAAIEGGSADALQKVAKDNPEEVKSCLHQLQDGVALLHSVRLLHHWCYVFLSSFDC